MRLTLIIPTAIAALAVSGAIYFANDAAHANAELDAHLHHYATCYTKGDREVHVEMTDTPSETAIEWSMANRCTFHH